MSKLERRIEKDEVRTRQLDLCQNKRRLRQEEGGSSLALPQRHALNRGISGVRTLYWASNRKLSVSVSAEILVSV
jgi:hypothetical protein